jgi:peptidoglycan endopeptidase LytF
VVAPVAFLAAATAAVLLIRAGIQGGNSTPTPTRPAAPVTRTATQPTKPKPKAKPKPVRRFYTIESGDTYATIASRFGTTVDQLRTLNPGVDEHALTVGQRIRVK